MAICDITREGYFLVVVCHWLTSNLDLESLDPFQINDVLLNLAYQEKEDVSQMEKVMEVCNVMYSSKPETQVLCFV